jgi:tetratricopeptide (TPR) repeat protein
LNNLTSAKIPIRCVVCLLIVSIAWAQEKPGYDAVVQKGKTQLQAGRADLALASGEAAIQMDADRWEGYALAGGALMNLQRYEEAVDKISRAVDRAPEAKQTALRDLQRQCLLAESGPSPATRATVQATTTQAEIVLWKSIENSTKLEDFESYLKQYPQGAFSILARRRLAEAERERQRQAALFGDLPNSIWIGDGLAASGKIHDNLTVMVVFLENGRIAWRGFVDDKEDRAKVEQINSDRSVLAKDAFLRTHLPQLRNQGTFALENEIVKLNLASNGNVHCQLTFDGRREKDAISGTAMFKGDSTHEARGCEKWPSYQWHLQRTLENEH